jgi:chaperonin GroES
MKLKPVNDKIAVKPNPKKSDEVTESGIILPDVATQSNLVEGSVVASSEGMYSITGERIPMVVGVGDTILYTNGVGQEYSLNGETVLLLSQNEVVSILGDD